MAVKQDVIQRLAPPPGRLDINPQLGLDPVLADVIVQPLGPQGGLDSAFFKQPARTGHGLMVFH